MNTMKLVSGLALFILLAACEGNNATVTANSGETMIDSMVESLEPLYSEKDAIYDPSLEGDWLLDGDADSVFHFAAAGRNAYRVTIKDDLSVFDVHLLRIGSRLLLDAAPVEWKGRAAAMDLHLGWNQTGVELAPGFKRLEDNIYLEIRPVSIDNSGARFRVRIRATHMFFWLFREEQAMVLVPLSGNWLAEGVKNGSLSIDHVMAGEQPVLSARTADLQKLVAEHENDPEAFGMKLNFQRKNQVAAGGIVHGETSP